MALIPTVAPGQVRQDISRAPGNALQQTQTSAADFGGGQGRDLQNLGAVVQKIGATSLDLVNAALVQDSTNKLATASRAIALKYKQMRGQDAIGSANRAKEEFDAATVELAKGLQSRAQREAYSQQAEGMKMSTLGQVEYHEVAERQVYKNEVEDATLFNTVQNGKSFITDQNGYFLADREMLQGVEVVRSRYAHLGEKVQNAEVAKYKSNFHKEMVDVQSDNPTAALSYLEANKGEMDPAYVNEMTKRLSIVDDTQKIDLISKEIFAKPEEERAKLLADVDPKYRNDVRREVASLSADLYGSTMKGRNESFLSEVEKMKSQANYTPPVGSDEQTFQALWRINGQIQASKGTAAGTEAVTDVGYTVNLYNRMSTTDPKNIRALELEFQGNIHRVPKDYVPIMQDLLTAKYASVTGSTIPVKEKDAGAKQSSDAYKMAAEFIANRSDNPAFVSMDKSQLAMMQKSQLDEYGQRYAKIMSDPNMKNVSDKNKAIALLDQEFMAPAFDAEVDEWWNEDVTLTLADMNYMKNSGNAIKSGIILGGAIPVNEDVIKSALNMPDTTPRLYKGNDNVSYFVNPSNGTVVHSSGGPVSAVEAEKIYDSWLKQFQEDKKRKAEEEANSYTRKARDFAGRVIKAAPGAVMDYFDSAVGDE